MTTGHTHGRRRTAVAVLSMPVLAVCAATAQAEVGYALDIGVGHSDNISRAPAGQEDETIASLGAAFQVSHTSPRLDAEIIGRGQYLEYLDNSFDSEVVAHLIGDVKLDLIQERLSWLLNDTFGQVTTDQFSPATPGNRENVNYLETGPDLTLPLGSRLDLIVSGRYSSVHYETSPLGSERRRGEVTLRRRTSPSSNLSLNVKHEEVESEDSVDALDFERREALVRYDLQSGRTSFDSEVGYTELRPQAASTIAISGEKSDGLLARLRLTRRVSDSVTVGLEAGREFSDAGELFRQLQTGQPVNGGPLTQPVQEVSSPFTNTYGTLRWEFERNRTAFQLRGSLYKEEYESQPQFDRRRTEASGSVRRRMSPTRTLRLTGFYTRQEYESLDRSFDDLTALAALDWRLGQSNYFSLQYQYFRRNDELSSGDFSENQVWLRFGFFGGSGRVGGMPEVDTGF